MIFASMALVACSDGTASADLLVAYGKITPGMNAAAVEAAVGVAPASSNNNTVTTTYSWTSPSNGGTEQLKVVINNTPLVTVAATSSSPPYATHIAANGTVTFK